jgi:hypothetical protein
MKPSERLFKFPIKLYHQFYLNKAEEEERESSPDTPIEASWVEGYARVHIDEIVGWYETFSRGMSMEKIEKKGPDITLVQTERQGDFMCLWPRRRFEIEYDEYMEKWNGWMAKEMITLPPSITNSPMENDEIQLSSIVIDANPQL